MRALPAWLALAAGLLIFWCTRHYVEDDSFINFRYVANWIAGHGIVWNPGERVEGYTSLLMILWLRATEIVPMLLAARIAGVLGLAVTVVAVARHFKAEPTLQSTALVLLLTSLPLIVWSQAGLETLPFTALVTCASLLTLRALEGGRIPPLLGILYGLAVLGRPEGMLCAGIAFGWLALRRPAWRELAVAVGLFALIAGVQLLWRHGYYGEWLPNTYYAKLSATFSVAQLAAGWSYVSSYLLRPPFLLMAVVVAAFTVRRRSDGFLVSTIGIYLAYIIYSGGDWMLAHRFLVPLIPLMVLVVVRALEALVLHPRAALVPWVALLFGLMPLTQLREGWYPKFPVYLAAIGNYIDTHWEKDALVATNMAGIIPAMSMQQRYVDMLGLNDKTIARRAVSFTSGDRVGHIKGDGLYVLSREPDYIIFGDAISQNVVPTATYVSEKEMMELPEFAMHYVLKSDVLTVAGRGLAPREITFRYFIRQR